MMEEVVFDWGLWIKINQVNYEVYLYSGSVYCMMIICCFMEKLQIIVGFKVGWFLVDEFDVLLLIKVQQVWCKIIVWMCYKVDGLCNCVDVIIILEGFKFVFQQFVKQLCEKLYLQDLYGLVQVSIYDNEVNLLDDYIDLLMELYLL